jgi:lysozyme family protein
MADFMPAFKVVFDREGGFVNSKIDRGGATNYGVSLRFLKGCGVDVIDLDNDGITTELMGDMNNDGKVDIADIRLLTPDHAKKLFFKYFWCVVNAGMIMDQRVATLLFDMAVNSGPVEAARHLQMSLRHLGESITVDGKIGKESLKAINNYPDATKLCAAYITNRKTFYINIVHENPGQSGNLQGWMNRLAALKAELKINN